jgi:hypothetical protein
MTNKLSSHHNNSSLTTNTAADSQTVLTPEQVVEQLRVLRASMPEVTPLTAKERRKLSGLVRSNPDVLQAQIDVIGASDTIKSALGSSPEDAQILVQDDNRWSTVEAELQALLNGVSGGNLVRREKLQLLGARAFGLGTWLARGDDHAELKPHVERVRRLKRLARGRKSPVETPAPQPAPEGQNGSSGM